MGITTSSRLPRSEDYIIIYVVFRDLDTDLHYVQQANFIALGASMKGIGKSVATHNFYMFDVFGIQLPPETSPGFATIKEAVEAHKHAFADITPLTG